MTDMLNADGVEDESVGQNRLQQIHGWPAACGYKLLIIQEETSITTVDGSEGDQSKKLRGNYAGIGYTYDEDNEIFSKQPHASWTKNTSTAFGMLQSLIQCNR